MTPERRPDEQGNLGRYDDLCERVLHEIKAKAVVVIVIGGERGSGFSVATSDQRLMGLLPDLLHGVAQDMREQNNQ